MTCSQFTSTPEFIPGVCSVYINTPVDDLFLKITGLIGSLRKINAIYPDYLELQVEDFQFFICQLSLINNLSNKEISAINILPLYPNETLNLTTFSNTKPLSKWISLLKSGELIYILKHNRLITYFQAIIDVKNNSIYGYELLTRGLKRDGTIMPPIEMFDLARESGLTFSLDLQARETAIISAAKEKITQILFINFLPSVIYDPNVCLKTTIDLINKYNFPPHHITFEVVESEEIKDINHLITILDFYRKKGFRIALDDLGSGYSSLNNLSKLYPDYIKIDMGIIRDIHKDKLKQAIVEALVSMAKKSAIYVLAEGVETKEELDFLISRGVDFVQGYYFSKPTKKPLRIL